MGPLGTHLDIPFSEAFAYVIMQYELDLDILASKPYLMHNRHCLEIRYI